MIMASNPLILPKSESWKMFDQISGRYDFLNRVLSLGQDVVWRKKLLQFVPDRRAQKLLDLAAGTGDVLITLLESNPNIQTAVGVDMAEEMLKIGRAKIEKKNLESKVVLQKGDAQHLPFVDGSFDLLTIAFGIRNIPDLRLAMMEMYRVLKPGGRVLILEFSRPPNVFLRLGHIFYLRFIVPSVGFIFSGHYRAYKYLNQTVEQFPYGDRFCKIIKQMGFKNVQAYPLMGGVATIYAGDK